MKVVVARVWLAWLYIWATVAHSLGIALRKIIPLMASLRSMPLAHKPSNTMFIRSISGCGLWVWLSHIEYAAYISAAISDTPGAPNCLCRFAHVLAQVFPIWGRSIWQMQEPIMPCTCLEFLSQRMQMVFALRYASTYIVTMLFYIV